jgi:hypothetical protein
MRPTAGFTLGFYAERDIWDDAGGVKQYFDNADSKGLWFYKSANYMYFATYFTTYGNCTLSWDATGVAGGTGHTFVLTFDGQWYKLYVDGLLEDSTDLTSDTVDYTGATSVYSALGAAAGGSPAGNGPDGVVADLFFYSDGKSATDVATILNEIVPGLIELDATLPALTAAMEITGNITITATLPQLVASVLFADNITLAATLPTLLASATIVHHTEMELSGTIVLEASMTVVHDLYATLTATLPPLVAAMEIVAGSSMVVVASLPKLSCSMVASMEELVTIEATLPTLLARMFIEDAADFDSYELRFTR